MNENRKNMKIKPTVALSNQNALYDDILESIPFKFIHACIIWIEATKIPI